MMKVIAATVLLALLAFFAATFIYVVMSASNFHEEGEEAPWRE